MNLTTFNPLMLMSSRSENGVLESYTLYIFETDPEGRKIMTDAKTRELHTRLVAWTDKHKGSDFSTLPAFSLMGQVVDLLEFAQKTRGIEYGISQPDSTFWGDEERKFLCVGGDTPHVRKLFASHIRPLQDLVGPLDSYVPPTAS